MTLDQPATSAPAPPQPVLVYSLLAISGLLYGYMAYAPLGWGWPLAAALLLQTGMYLSIWLLVRPHPVLLQRALIGAGFIHLVTVFAMPLSPLPGVQDNTLHPALLQYVYGYLSYFFPGQYLYYSIALRIIHIFSALAALYFLEKLILYRGLPLHLLLVYLLNPLVVWEFTVQLAPLAFMLALLLGALWRYSCRDWALALVLYTLAVHTSLVALVAVPWLLHSHPLRVSLLWLAGFAFLSLGLYLPFLQAEYLRLLVLQGMAYPPDAGWNSGIYWLLQHPAVSFAGENGLIILSRLLSLLSLIWVWTTGWLGARSQHLGAPAQVLLWCLAIVLLLGPDARPAHTALLLGLALLTRWRWPLVWACILPLAYLKPPGQDLPLWVLLVEYALTGGYMVWEIGEYRREKAVARIQE